MRKNCDEIRKRIVASLGIHVRPKDKEFWYGFLVALVDYKVISHEEYKKLRNMVSGW